MNEDMSIVGDLGEQRWLGAREIQFLELGSLSCRIWSISVLFVQCDVVDGLKDG